MNQKLHPSEISLLKVFITVAECRGVAAAAERLGVAPSTISTQLLNLEARLGLKLCNRGRSGFSMTPEGELVQIQALKIFDQMHQFSHKIGSLKGSLVGQLTIAIVDNTVTNDQIDLPKALRLFQTRFPNVQIIVKITPPEHLEQSVLDRRIDIGIGMKQQTFPCLVYKKLCAEQVVICCGRHHPLFDLDQDDIDIAQLTACNWVSDFYRLPKKIPQATPPFLNSYTTNIEASLYLILTGSHLGTLPNHYILKWLESGELRILKEKELSHYLKFSLITHENRKNDAIIANFKAVIDEIMQ